MKIAGIISLILIYTLGCDQKSVSESASSEELTSYSLENCVYVRNTVGQIVSWKSLVPVRFYFSKQVPEHWRELIKEAAESWKTLSGRQLIEIDFNSLDSAAPNNDRRNIIYWIDSGMLLNYQQAITMTRWLKNQIIDTDILINSKDFVFYVQNPETYNSIHFKSLLIHEFGHALGLKHTTKTVSVMYPELGFLEVRSLLSDADVTSVKCEYP